MGVACPISRGGLLLFGGAGRRYCCTGVSPTAPLSDGLAELATLLRRHFMPALAELFSPGFPLLGRHVLPVLADLAAHALPFLGAQGRPSLRKEARCRIGFRRKPIGVRHCPSPEEDGGNQKLGQQRLRHGKGLRTVLVLPFSPIPVDAAPCAGRSLLPNVRPDAATILSGMLFPS